MYYDFNGKDHDIEEDSGEEDGSDDELEDIGIKKFSTYFDVLHMVSPYNSLSY